MSEHHNTTIVFTGSGCRSRCNGCNWMGTNHIGSPPGLLAHAWYKATQDGRNHTADHQRRTR